MSSYAPGILSHILMLSLADRVLDHESSDTSSNLPAWVIEFDRAIDAWKRDARTGDASDDEAAAHHAQLLGSWMMAVSAGMHQLPPSHRK